MIQKSYMVINEQDEYEYDLIVKKTIKNASKFELYASNNSTWTEHAKGELLLAIKDTGNGIIFDRKIQKSDYATAEHIRIVLMFMHDVIETIKNKYKFVEKVVTIEI